MSSSLLRLSLAILCFASSSLHCVYGLSLRRGGGGGSRGRGRDGGGAIRGGHRQQQQQQQQQQNHRHHSQQQHKGFRAREVDCDVVAGSLPWIIHRSSDLLVVSKPAGWAAARATSGPAPPRPSLQQWLLQCHACDLAGGVYSHVSTTAHAIDSSGLVVFTNSTAAATARLPVVTSRVLCVVDARRSSDLSTQPLVFRDREDGMASSSSPSSSSSSSSSSPPPPPASSSKLTVMHEGGHGMLVEVNISEALVPLRTLGYISAVGSKEEAAGASGVTADLQARQQLAGRGCAVRGDARFGDPVDRRAPRALWHSAEVVVEEVQEEQEGKRLVSSFSQALPCDMALAAGPCNPIRARDALEADPFTTCYRLLHAGADVLPQASSLESSPSPFSVDRYADWLVVQHNIDDSRLPPWPRSAEAVLEPLGLAGLLLDNSDGNDDDDDDDDDDETCGDGQLGSSKGAPLAGAIGDALRGRGAPVRGVYYSMAPRDRSRVPTADLLAMCTPRLLPFRKTKDEGATGSAAVAARAADEEGVAVLEHGVAYRVKLGEDLSTGLFLDQRPQRAWLRRHLRDGDRLLNCFAHAGGYSIGASTVSVDLSKMWLERVPESLHLNGLGVNYDDASSADPAEKERPRRDVVKHDTIYGDCFDWLKRLGSRVGTSGGVDSGRFEVVILDPPTTSTGKSKKRWSAARDYPELVALAAPLVASGGALWTTTNHRGTSPHAFAALVEKGLQMYEEAGGAEGSAEGGAGGRGGGGGGGGGGQQARRPLQRPLPWALEKSCPPAVDFPCCENSPPHVKTLIWRRLS